MDALAKHIVTALVENKDAVQVELVESEDSTTVHIHVAPEDMGRVIGKHGKIANALRTVMKAAGMRNQQKIYVEIDE